ncbi:salicylate synthase [Streptomyces sp. NPDC005374]|uniref:salicylate synthase n=1 Tax=Streptomyces sp. NPDC005374 TaxID=3364713 RepID=UPI00368003FD
MTSATTTLYLEHDVPLATDPLAAVAQLASSGLHEDYVLYERNGEWSFAGGVLAEVCLDRSGARIRGPEGETLLPWDGAPLRQIQSLLAELAVADWRAYGWAAFELAYAKGGDRTTVGDQRLLHLVVPETEVRLKNGVARVRCTDPKALERTVAALAGPSPAPGRPNPVNVRQTGAEEYQQAVALAIEEIHDHKLQKVILSRVLPLGHDVDLVGTYVAGRRGNNPARSFLLRLDGIEAAGFSPEIVVSVSRDGRVVSQPLAGTRAVTSDPELNRRLRSELLADPKEVFEHAISVRIALDELEAVCRPGSMAVEEFMAVRERGTVQHLASRIAGKLAEGHSAWDAFGAVFPAVTASGVPKDAAYATIRNHESRARGLYSGAVLTVDQDGFLDAALILRAVYRHAGTAWLQAGAGIVSQSRPVREFEETCEKLDSVARFLVSA